MMSIWISRAKGKVVDLGARALVSLYERCKNSTAFRNHIFRYLRDDLVLARADGNQYLVKSKDPGIGRHLYVRQRSEELALLEIVFDSLTGDRPLSLIDIGANYGSMAISALRLGMVESAIGFEPDPLLANLAAVNATLNGLEARYEIRQLALGAVGARMELELSELNSGDNRIRMTDKPGLFSEQNRCVIEVEQSTLDEQIDSEALSSSFVVCDVQGYEGHVLSGARRMRELAIPCVLEFWPYGLSRVNGLDLLKESILDSSYKYLKVLERGDTFVEISASLLDDLCSEYRPSAKHDGGYANLLLIG